MKFSFVSSLISLFFILSGNAALYAFQVDYESITEREEFKVPEERDMSVPQRLAYYDQLTKDFVKVEDYDAAIISRTKMAGIQIGLWRLPEARKLIKETEKMYKRSSQDSLILADIYYRKGVYYDYNGQIDSALYTHHFALKIRRAFYGDNSRYVASSLISIGEIYHYTLGDYYNADQFYQRAQAIYDKNPSIATPVRLANLYYVIASCLRNVGDTDLANSYAFKAFHLFQETNASRYLDLSSCLNAMGTAYFTANEYDKAIVSFKEAIELIQKEPYYMKANMPIFQSNLAAVYINQKDYPSAINTLDEVIASFDQKSDPALFPIYLQMVSAQTVKAPQQARKYMALARDMLPGHSIAESKEASVVWSQFYHYTGQQDSAIYYAEIVLQHEGVFHWETLSEDSLAMMNVPQVLDGMKMVANGYTKMYLQHPAPDYLDKALQAYISFDRVLMHFRSNIKVESAKVGLAGRYKSVYESGLGVVSQMWKTQPDSSLARVALRFMENSKSLSMLDYIRHAELLDHIGVEDSIRSQENELVSRIAKCQAILQTQPGDSLLVLLKEEYFQLQKNLQMLKQTMSSSYPKYFESKYGTERVSLKQLSLYLQKNEASMAEYFYGDSTAFRLYIEMDGSISLDKLKDFEGLKSDLSAFRSHFMAKPSYGDELANFQEFTRLGNRLYTRLLPADISEVRNLILIPDGALSTVPFESFLSSATKSLTVDYRNLDYLVRSCPISYGFSAQLLVEDSENTLDNNNIMAFSYGQSESAVSNLDLLGAQEELKHMASLFPIASFSGNAATKRNFFSNAGEADIIHMAVHGRANMTNPMKAALIFRDSLGLGVDSLFYYELMNIPMKANLAVLASCETGMGKYLDGEGVFNLARGFRYAGCKSLLASLWQVDDMSTSKIISGFYGHFKKGKNLAQSIQLAKLDYINTSDEQMAHPRYWAGMVPVGNAAAGTNHLFLWYALVFAGLLLTLYLNRRKLREYSSSINRRK
ncbi:hypothetical protein GCM10007049_28560 [Echinicola pacifica]|uniref:CHAT domain-containing protein n=1 Tax=Echinicola pacifica TaxID=346377 RepID=A0A918Q730_9BACT|nr:CHAT domain-containing tetratricopeptide repeat protein [Echinicola pacifica]GGZ33207.1 hypothetical protein GCM10007049_28560 [Echinicola pacifica]